MKNRDRIRERFLKNDVSRRLAGIAADLGRVASSARREAAGERVSEMLEESQYFIEWTAVETQPEVGELLAEIQVMLALWRLYWPESQKDPRQRNLLSVQAQQWSGRVLQLSGLANG
jgi:hypothetical protein